MKIKNLFLSAIALAAFAGTTYSVTNIDQYVDSVVKNNEINTNEGLEVYNNDNLTLSLLQNTSTVGADDYVDVYGVNLTINLSSFVNGTQSTNSISVTATLDFTNAKYDFDTNGGGEIEGEEIGQDYVYQSDNEDSLKLQYTPTQSNTQIYSGSQVADFVYVDENTFTSTIIIPQTQYSANIQVVNDVDGTDFLNDGKTVVQDSFELYLPEYYYSYASNLPYYDNMEITYTGTTLNISYEIVNNGFNVEHYVSSSSELNLTGYFIVPFKTIDDPSSDNVEDVINASPNTALATYTELLVEFDLGKRTLMTQTVNESGNYEIEYTIDLSTSTDTFNFNVQNNISTSYANKILLGNDLSDDDGTAAGTQQGWDFTNSWESMTFLQMIGQLEKTANGWGTSTLVDGDIDNISTYLDFTKSYFIPSIQLEANSVTDTTITTYNYSMLSKGQYELLITYTPGQSGPNNMPSGSVFWIVTGTTIGTMALIGGGLYYYNKIYSPSKVKEENNTKAKK